MLDEGIQYFRDARYREALVLLSAVDRLLDVPSVPVEDRTRAKFYLALSFPADGETDRARTAFRSLYELDLEFEPPEALPDQLREMVELKRSNATRTVCHEAICAVALTALRAGTFTDGQISPSCPCVDEAVDATVKKAQELLVSREYSEAFSRAAPLVELRPDNADARMVADLARNVCDLTQRSLYDRFEQQFSAGELDGAGRTAIAMWSQCGGANPDLLRRTTGRYQSALAVQVQRWQSA